MWPNERVVHLARENFLTARVHARDQAEDFKRFGAKYGAQWTPAILFLAPDGVERRRIEGSLPVEDFLAQMTLGLGHLAFHASRWGEAERAFESVIEQFGGSEAAPEAQYWAGVSRYKASGDPVALRDTATAFMTKYQGTSWAKKASVWA